MADRFPFAKFFGEITVLSELAFRPGDKPYLDRPASGADAKELLLYLGCNVLRTPHLAQSAVDVLRGMGFDFNAVGGPAYCCGIVHALNGAPDASRAYSGNTLRNVERLAPQHVIMWCPSCNEHFDDVVSQQHDVRFPYEHMTAFVARHLDRVTFVRPVPKRVALHYHTGHPQQDLDHASVVRILTAIPGLEHVAIPSTPAFGRHCSTKYINRLGVERWRAEIAGVMDHAAAERVDVLATIYHSCHREICAQEQYRPFAIVNYISLLAEAMGIEHADDYKRRKLAADPDAVYDEVRDYVAANGLDEARVREVLAKTFAPACAFDRPPSS